MARDWLRIVFIGAIVVFSLCMVFVGLTALGNVRVPGVGVVASSTSQIQITGGNFGSETSQTTPTISEATSTTSSWNGIGYGCSPGGCTPCDKQLGSCTGYSLLSLLLWSGPLTLNVAFWVALIAGLLILGFLIAILSKKLKQKRR